MSVSEPRTTDRQMDVLMRQYNEEAVGLVESLYVRMNNRAAPNIGYEELEGWIAKADGVAQALRDIKLLRRLGARA